jgi:hypothetical protein
MNRIEQTEALLDALARLEACLETPMVPGGLPAWALPAWAGEASEAIAEVGVHLRRRIETHHQQPSAEIVSQDADLVRRGEETKDEDRALMELHKELLDRIAPLCERAGEGPPRATIREEDVSSIIEQGLSLVLRIRKQERALTT